MKFGLGSGRRAGSIIEHAWVLAIAVFKVRGGAEMAVVYVWVGMVWVWIVEVEALLFLSTGVSSRGH